MHLCGDPPLLVAEDKIDPKVQVRAHILALERAAVDGDELLGCLGPRRKHNVPHALAVLFGSEKDVLVHTHTHIDTCIYIYMCVCECILI